MRVYEILSEGLIKLPTKMHAKLINELRTVCVSYMRTKLNLALSSSDADSEVKKESLSQFDAFWRKKYSNVKFRKIALDPNELHVKDIGVIKKAELPANYAKLFDRDLPYEFEFDPSKSIKAQFKFDFKELSSDGARAMYRRDEKNVIEVDLKKIKTMNFMVYVEEIEKLLDGESTQSNINRLLERIYDEMIELEGLTEHELAHAVQFLVLSRGSIDQTIGDVGGAKASNKPTAGYTTSQVEFDPLIKSLVKGFVKWNNKITRAEGKPIDWKVFVKYFVGAISDDDFHEKTKIRPTTEYPEQAKFFQDLKQHDRSKWQKAIKLFTLSVEELIK
jgi:hypothetical protein